MEWVPIEDEILANNIDMLICDAGGVIYIGWFDDHDNKFYDTHDDQILDVTHFIYLNELDRPSRAYITNDECLKHLLKQS